MSKARLIELPPPPAEGASARAVARSHRFTLLPRMARVRELEPCRPTASAFSFVVVGRFDRPSPLGKPGVLLRLDLDDCRRGDVPEPWCRSLT